MNPPDAFAPPKSAVLDVDVDTGSAMPTIPLWFKVLLILFIAIEVLGHVARADFSGLVWLGVMAIASWQTLKGNRAASRVLGGLLVLASVLGLWGAVNAFASGHVAYGGVCVGFVVYMAALAACLFFHPAMQAVFRRADRQKWSA